MRYRVRIEGRTFEAEVGNVDARPIVVVVEGERFEVWPEHLPAGEAAPRAEEGVSPAPLEARPAAPAGPMVRPAAEPGPQRPVGGATAQIRAPIPGVIDSVAVRPGDKVAPGDPLCVVEAMKMKNVIRAGRPGTVEEVLVAPGQHVKHGDVLVEFVE